MLFNSNAFYVFLPIVFAVYWLTPRRYRWGVLLVSSYYFYMSADAQYVLLLLLTTLVSYSTALLMSRAESRKQKKLCLGAALAVCLGLLIFFKYFNFLSGTVTAVLKSISLPVSEVTLNLVLPTGISFYVFQTLGYVIDVYKGKTKACTHFGKYAVFVSFFPLLLAGPIERAEHLLPQLEKEHSFDSEKAIEGAKLIAWGYFKKIAIADVVVSCVNAVYDQVTVYTGLALGVATFFYAFQVYCDFSGYSDIARGVAKLLDIDLMTNFKSPYFAASLKEFWSRWHISLSTWFRDYVYIPLGGNRKGAWRTRINLLVTFLVSGLWHGADWTFVIWGGLHGLGQIVEKEWNRHFPPRKDRRSAVRVLIVFIFVCIAWIFFRANTFSDAIYVVTHLFDGIGNPISYVKEGYLALRSAGIMQSSDLKLVFVWIAVLLAHDWIELRQNAWEWLGRFRKPVRYAFYFALLFVVLYSRQLGEYEFVYFQF